MVYFSYRNAELPICEETIVIIGVVCWFPENAMNNIVSGPKDDFITRIAGESGSNCCRSKLLAWFELDSALFRAKWPLNGPKTGLFDPF